MASTSTMTNAPPPSFNLPTEVRVFKGEQLAVVCQLLYIDKTIAPYIITDIREECLDAETVKRLRSLNRKEHEQLSEVIRIVNPNVTTQTVWPSYAAVKTTTGYERLTRKEVQIRGRNKKKRRFALKKAFKQCPPEEKPSKASKDKQVEEDESDDDDIFDDDDDDDDDDVGQGTSVDLNAGSPGRGRDSLKRTRLSSSSTGTVSGHEAAHGEGIEEAGGRSNEEGQSSKVKRRRTTSGGDDPGTSITMKVIEEQRRKIAKIDNEVLNIDQQIAQLVSERNKLLNDKTEYQKIITALSGQ